jgi:hypothetical protein
MNPCCVVSLFSLIPLAFSFHIFLYLVISIMVSALAFTLDVVLVNHMHYAKGLNEFSLLFIHFIPLSDIGYVNFNQSLLIPNLT